MTLRPSKGKHGNLGRARAIADFNAASEARCGATILELLRNAARSPNDRRTPLQSARREPLRCVHLPRPFVQKLVSRNRETARRQRFIG